ncbi:hypothetical protein [Chryseobacterium sp. W4I1]|uniref:hypothetical protein n=1 Tax=Chryseobacterium sp. W4I1 TaxID=3042293 RepID=UPI002787A0C4|nr:hypothetical protein [Chryseobacterium sp. W4I1]MDQ0781251.1 hypothetical protein [Chryseobacterium sp. W4I1]
METLIQILLYRDTTEWVASHGMYFANNDGGGFAAGDTYGEGPDNNPKPGTWQSVKNFFRSIFGGGKEGAGITTLAIGAQITRVVQIGEAIQITTEVYYSGAGILATRGLLALPLILNGDNSHARGYDIPLTGTTDIPTDEPEQRITLYRGVCVGHYDYKNAIKGMAVPLGGHSDPGLHNWGDTESVFTSWTTNINVARRFANKNGSGGVILSKEFPIHQIIPSPDESNEQEILIRGIVTGAFPFMQKR